jgi:hypothetical protein
MFQHEYIVELKQDTFLPFPKTTFYLTMRITPRFSIAFLPLTVCLLLAVALWLYASMREEYSTVIDVPLEIRLPSGRALETEVASTIRAQVQGAGWQLVNHFLSSAIRCVVDIPAKRIIPTVQDQQATFSLSRQTLAQAIQAPVGVLVQRIVSDSLVLAVGTIASKRVPIRATLDVEPREGFICTLPVRLTPDSVTIRSSRKVLARIGSWQTGVIALRDVYEPVQVQTELADTLSGVVQFQRIQISCAVNVQQMAEMSFQDIPILCLGAPNTSDIGVRPMRVSVLLRGGIDDIAKLIPEQIRVSIDYNLVLTTQTGILKPTVSVPMGLSVARVSPAYLRVVRRVGQSVAAW